MICTHRSRIEGFIFKRRTPQIYVWGRLKCAAPNLKKLAIRLRKDRRCPLSVSGLSSGTIRLYPTVVPL